MKYFIIKINLFILISLFYSCCGVRFKPHPNVEYSGPDHIIYTDTIITKSVKIDTVLLPIPGKNDTFFIEKNGITTKIITEYLPGEKIIEKINVFSECKSDTVYIKEKINIPKEKTWFEKLNRFTFIELFFLFSVISVAIPVIRYILKL